jgi:hypothetical protein
VRIIESKRGYFRGTHKGATLDIQRDPASEGGRFYIRVQWKDGGHLYDGWAPDSITTMPAAKREALRGAGLT